MQNTPVSALVYPWMSWDHSGYPIFDILLNSRSYSKTVVCKHIHQAADQFNRFVCPPSFMNHNSFDRSCL